MIKDESQTTEIHQNSFLCFNCSILIMLNDENVVGYLYEGKKFDCGSRHGYVNAIKYLAKETLDD